MQLCLIEMLGHRPPGKMEVMSAKTENHCLSTKLFFGAWKKSGKPGRVKQRETAWNLRERQYLCVNDSNYAWTTRAQKSPFLDQNLLLTFFVFGSKTCELCQFVQHVYPDSILGWPGSFRVPMSSNVSNALERAAQRAKRRAEMETARLVLERNLGHDVADGEFPWLSVLSMPYSVHECFTQKQTRWHTAQSDISAWIETFILKIIKLY